MEGPSCRVVTLREITRQTVREVCRLSDALLEHQKRMVAPNAVSIAQAHFDPKAWFRAIYADEQPVGFVMIYDDPGNADYYLWRFMISGPHQGHGYGRRALELVLDYIRSRPNAAEVKLGYVPIDGNPGPFYRKLGFVPTGEISDGEVVMRYRFAQD